MLLRAFFIIPSLPPQKIEWQSLKGPQFYDQKAVRRHSFFKTDSRTLIWLSIFGAKAVFYKVESDSLTGTFV